jgi:HTH-type transcriptional regulator/antitoxin HigA
MVCELLRRYGIRFVVVEPLERCRIDGAAFWIDAGKPAIAMSLRFGRVDNFWFVLMHEIAHIANGDAASVDVDLAGKDQVPSRMKSIAERMADEAASADLVDPQELSQFITMFSPLYSKARIAQFAHRIKMYPGVIVGQLQHRGELSWESHRDYLVNVRDYVTSTALTDGWGKSIGSETLS